MEFRKYQHLERFGTTEVSGIEIGRCYVFPKLDGTNASLWHNGFQLCAGSRNRQLSTESDNAGFYNWAKDQMKFEEFFFAHPNLTLYGEWLVPHSLKTYRNDTWREFYVFDVVDANEVSIPYDTYAFILQEFQIKYIPPIAVVTNPTYDDLVRYLDANTYLIQDGKGAGEGIVIKNYDFVNQYGRTVWAKLVRSEFKELHSKTFGAPEKENILLEEEIAIKYCTCAMIDKVYDKLITENNGWTSKNIPQLLNTVYYDVIREESWNIVKEFKNPQINFKTLQHFVFHKVKKHKAELF